MGLSIQPFGGNGTISNTDSFNLSNLGGSPSQSGGFLGGIFGGASNPVSGAISGAVTDGLSALLGGLLDFDLQANINNVMQYGLNSWGASTDPERIKVRMQLVVDYFQNLASGYESDINGTLNNIDYRLNILIGYYNHLLEDHARANSTKRAYEQMISFLEELKSNVLTKVITALKAKGVVFITTPMRTRTMPTGMNELYSEGTSGGNQEHVYLSYNEHVLQIPKTLTENEVVDTVEQQTGVVSSSTSKGSSLSKVAMAFGAFFLIKKIF